MSKPSVHVEGLTELRKALKRIGDEGLVDALKAANKSAAELVANRAIPTVPVRTGKLRASVKALGTQRDGRVKAGTAAVNHAATIHFGRKQGNVGRPPGNHKGPNIVRGRPFLDDAAEASMSEVTDRYEREIEDLLDMIRGR